MLDIKPCPFCGGAAQLIHATEYPSGDRYRVACSDCGCTTWPRIIGGRRAIEVWNRRVKED